MVISNANPVLSHPSSRRDNGEGSGFVSSKSLETGNILVGISFFLGHSADTDFSFSVRKLMLMYFYKTEPGRQFDANVSRNG